MFTVCSRNYALFGGCSKENAPVDDAAGSDTIIRHLVEYYYWWQYDLGY